MTTTTTDTAQVPPAWVPLAEHLCFDIFVLGEGLDKGTDAERTDVAAIADELRRLIGLAELLDKQQPHLALRDVVEQTLGDYSESLSQGKGWDVRVERFRALADLRDEIDRLDDGDAA